MEAKATLPELRALIDGIDEALIKLLVMRMQCSLKIKHLKPAIEDPSREEQVYENIRALVTEPLDPDFCEELYRLIISESKRLQTLV
jgi:chorismate mutase